MIIDLKFIVESGVDALEFSSLSSRLSITYFCGYPDVMYLANQIENTLREVNNDHTSRP